jgi:glycosyltransferase involved in cell wall biosynthesis
MRVFFWAPATSKPTGGIANYFALAQTLRELGYEASVVSDEGLGTWYLPPDIDGTWRTRREVSLAADDVVVTPEWWQHVVEDIQPARLLPYVQFPVTNTYQGLVMALSSYCANVARDQGGEPYLVERILTPFWQRPEREERAGVLMLPLKNGWQHMISVATALHDSGLDVTIADRHNTAQELRALLWRHEVFVALSYPEGLDMISQEAMACGCLVAAFDGGGRRDYLQHQVTGWMAENGDEARLVEGVHWLLANRAVAENAAAAIEHYRPATARAQIAALAAGLDG